MHCIWGFSHVCRPEPSPPKQGTHIEAPMDARADTSARTWPDFQTCTRVG